MPIILCGAVQDKVREGICWWRILFQGHSILWVSVYLHMYIPQHSTFLPWAFCCTVPPFSVFLNRILTILWFRGFTNSITTRSPWWKLPEADCNVFKEESSLVPLPFKNMAVEEANNVTNKCRWTGHSIDIKMSSQASQTLVEWWMQENVQGSKLCMGHLS